MLWLNISYAPTSAMTGMGGEGEEGDFLLPQPPVYYAAGPSNTICMLL